MCVNTADTDFRSYCSGAGSCASCAFPLHGRKGQIFACNSIILGSRFETGIYETAFSAMLPVSCAGTDGAGESQVMAQRKIV